MQLEYQSLFLKSQFEWEYYDTTKDVLPDIQHYDMSALWMSNFQQYTLGYIGEDYQRFWIRLLNIKKHNRNSKSYLVTGKTRVRENVCDFSGTIDLVKAIMQKSHELPHIKQGAIIGIYEFNEDPKQTGSGKVIGTFVTHWFIDSMGIHYDSLTFAASDAFCNNQFSGNWYSYKTKTIKKCNWGDVRIPFSNELDIGVGEFYPDKKWIANGWESFVGAYTKSDTASKRIEKEEWWRR